MLSQTANAKFTGEDSVRLMHQWQFEFNTYLLRHSNPDLRAYGVRSLYFNEDEKVLKEVVKTFSELSTRTDLKDSTFTLLSYVCEDENFEYKCDELGLINNYINHYPSNLNAYFVPLERALKVNDQSSINNIINSMSHTDFLNEWIRYSSEYDETLNYYANAFPFPNNVIEFEIADMKKRNKFSEAKQKHIIDNMPGYMLLITKIGVDFAMPSPYYKSLNSACENKSLFKNCLEIAEIMITNSHTIMSKVFGFKLKLNILNTIKEISEANQVESQLASFKSEYTCLINLNYFDNIYTMNLAQETAKQKVSRDKGELAGLSHYAKMKYVAAQKRGDENSESLNPDLCIQE